MAYRDTIRTQVARTKATLITNGLMPTVQWYAQTLPDATGSAGFVSTPTACQVVVEDADVRVLNQYGTETPVRAKLTFLDGTLINAGDRIVLPGNRDHLVVRCDPSVLDDSGVRFLSEVWLG